MKSRAVPATLSFYPDHLAGLDAISTANGNIGRSAANRLVFERFCLQEKALDIVRAHLAGAVSADGAMALLRKLVRAQVVEDGAAAGG